MLAKGDKLLQDMQFLWSNRWVKLNNMWKDPESGKCYGREQAVKLTTSRIRKQWIKQIIAEDSARGQSLQEPTHPTN
jgi:hypothetical protein